MQHEVDEDLRETQNASTQCQRQRAKGWIRQQPFLFKLRLDINTSFINKKKQKHTHKY